MLIHTAQPHDICSTDSWLSRLQRFPRKPDRLVATLRTVGAVTVRASLRLFHQFTIKGRENLPRKGPFVMIANHASHLDTLCLLSAMPIGRLHQTFPAAAQDYFSMNRLRFATAAIFANVMPFDRKEHLRGSLQLCRQLLSRGTNVLVLFPEGTRTTTGDLGEFRPGIGSLLAGTDVPVVPCALQGPFRAWPKGAWMPRPRKVQLIIGEPRCYSDRTPGRESSDRIARELHHVVKELLCK